MNERRRFFLSGQPLAIAVATVSVVVAVSAGAFFYVDNRAERLLSAREATIAEEDLKLLEDLFEEEGRAGLVRAVARRAALPSDNLGIVAVVDELGTNLAGNVEWPGDLRADRTWRPISTTAGSGETVDGFAIAITLADGARVLAGRDFSADRKFRASLSEAMIVALAALLIASLAVALGLNRLILSRIDAIAGAANRVGRDNLAERIPVGAERSEFDRLAQVLNFMLDRNETHLAQMRTMTDAIAHDLRVPLQRIKAGLRSSASVADPSRQQQAIEAAITDADDALRTFDALLAMARAEAGIGKDVFELVDLARLMNDIAELFGPLAEDKGQRLEVVTLPLFARGQTLLLKQAVGNLVQNAIKYAPPAGTITLRMAAHDRKVLLIVEDNGPGIPEADRAHAIQPFGRLTRDRHIEGSGLGLALAAAFASLHDGALRLDDAHPGLLATLELPEIVESGTEVPKLATN